jgi:hypothetical protein
MTAVANRSSGARAGRGIGAAAAFRLWAIGRRRVPPGFGVALRCSAGFVARLRYRQWVGTAQTGRGWRVGIPGAGIPGMGIVGAGVLSAGVLSARGDLVADRAAR